MRIFPASLTLLAAFLPCAAPAQTADPSTGGDFIIVGIGAGSVPDYEGSSHQQLVPVPGVVGSVGGIGFAYLGNQIRVDLIRAPDGPGWSPIVGPVASLGLNRASVKGIEDPRIRALGKVGLSVELGGMAGIQRRGVITSDYDRLSLTVSVRHDVAGGHGGTLIDPSITYMTPLSHKAMVLMFASATNADGHYARSYYRITPGQSAASGLPVFDARGGWKDLTLGGAGAVSLTGDLTHGLSLMGGVVYSRLINDFADSPVVSIAGSRDQWLLAVGLAYTF